MASPKVHARNTMCKSDENIIMVFNYSTTIIPLDMLQTKQTFFVVVDKID
jgi:hypothetical protein